MRSLWTAILAVPVGLVAGCAATGPLYQDPPPPPDGYAQVVIYRIPALAAGAHSAAIAIDGAHVADLKHEGYTLVLVKPGSHTVAGLRVTDLKAGMTYFVSYEAGSGLSPLLLPGETALVSDDAARRKIASYHFQRATTERLE